MILTMILIAAAITTLDLVKFRQIQAAHVASFQPSKRR
jgi:hypothetical protein